MGPENWERGCEGWRHCWLMLPASPPRTPTIPSPPPPSHWFCFPLHRPPCLSPAVMFILGGEVQEGDAQGSPHLLAQPLTPQTWCPCPAPHHLLRAPQSQARICLGGRKGEQIPPLLWWAQPQPLSHACDTGPVSGQLCGPFLMDMLSAPGFIYVFI